MPRRATRHGSRVVGMSAASTLVHSNHTTPLSSAYPSTYASEVEADAEDEVSRMICISSLRLQDGLAHDTRRRAVKAKTARIKPFPFMRLPSELRIRIYEYHFEDVGDVIDLDTDNYKRIHKKLAILRVCRTIYVEAAHYFFSSHAVRVFPTRGRFFKSKAPLLARLKPRQRALLTSLELRLGPGWNKPPRGWVVNAALGLRDCVNVRSLTVFVECDPSDGIFNGFRKADGFYEGFSRGLLAEVLAGLPHVDRVYFDAWTSVQKNGAMMRAVFEATLAQGRKIAWGPERGWTDIDEDDDVKFTSSIFATAKAENVLVLA